MIASGAPAFALFRHDLRRRIGEREDQRRSPSSPPSRASARRGRQAEEDVGAPHDLGQRARVVSLARSAPCVVHLLGAALRRRTPSMSVTTRCSPRQADLPPAGRGRRAPRRRRRSTRASRPRCSCRRPSRPLRTAAPTMIAVPCWSSWKTGIFIRSRSLRSTSKHSGALMSSRLMPPKVGSSAAMMSTSLSGSVSFDLDVEHVDAGELLEQHGLAFHHRLGRRAGRCCPRPSTAVPLVMTPTRLPRAV
jgi:hypothetical protein